MWKLLLALELAAASPGALPSVRTGDAAVVRREATRVRFEAGSYRMGASGAEIGTANRMCREELPSESCDFGSEGPDRLVWLSAFTLDRTEVTVAAYRACVRAGVCAPDPLTVDDKRFLEPEQPITSVTWDEAARYCAWTGGRLPTEAEWERAARGRTGRVWPWGNDPRPQAANHGRFRQVGDTTTRARIVVLPDSSDGWPFLAPVGSYPSGASAEGVLDLAGNAAEWVADWAPMGDAASLGSVNPKGPANGIAKIVRGGSWRQPLLFQRTTARDVLAPGARVPEVGFRCAR